MPGTGNVNRDDILDEGFSAPGPQPFQATATALLQTVPVLSTGLCDGRIGRNGGLQKALYVNSGAAREGKGLQPNLIHQIRKLLFFDFPKLFLAFFQFLFLSRNMRLQIDHVLGKGHDRLEIIGPH